MDRETEGVPADERGSDGRWLPGTSGNPEGKAKGTKNKMTLERLHFERALRLYMADENQAEKLLKGIDRVLNIAQFAEKDADSISAMKILLDRVMPAVPPKLEAEVEQTDRKLQIIIQTTPQTTTPVKAIIDGEATEIED